MSIITKFKKTVEKALDLYIIPNSQSLSNYIDNRSAGLGNYKLVKHSRNVSINQVIAEYRFYDIQKTDNVLDIGAHVGGFSMFISQSVNQVFAVEPIFTDILKANVTNNNINNIKILDVGVGSGRQDIKFMDRNKIVKCIPFSEILQMCGVQIDFLKCDCEGGEWNIKPNDLSGIRRIEAEIHSFNNEKLSDFPDMLESIGYDVSITNRSDNTMLIHATDKNLS